ncbi:hypothetical protein T03_8565 [Trichinella britovi]|uniref:Uncharacterized protein n=1 Tax=Trichinella britovi TaxID=45882 RepID=A0A0V1CDV5_TRIBR|nr:hypothetical protein T03_8565 [Trichinella britovi]
MYLSAIGMDFEKALQRVKSVRNVSPKHHLKLQNYYYVKCSQSPDDDIRKKRHCVRKLRFLKKNNVRENQMNAAGCQLYSLMSFGFAVESVAYNLLSFIQISIRLLYVL